MIQFRTDRFKVECIASVAVCTNHQFYGVVEAALGIEAKRSARTWPAHTFRIFLQARDFV